MKFDAQYKETDIEKNFDVATLEYTMKITLDACGIGQFWMLAGPKIAVTF